MWPYSFLYLKLVIFGWINILLALVLTYIAFFYDANDKILNGLKITLGIQALPYIFGLFFIGSVTLGLAKVLELLHKIEINTRPNSALEDIAYDVENINLRQIKTIATEDIEYEQ